MLTFDADDVDSGDLMAFARAYATLGDAMQSQLREALDGGDRTVREHCKQFPGSGSSRCVYVTR